MFQRILVPLDGSGRAEQVLSVAARLARASSGTIILVRVMSTAPAAVPSVPAGPLLAQTVGGMDQTQAESYLRALAESQFPPGIEVKMHVAVGAIPASVLSIATNEQADIIIMCGHGYTGIRRWWMMGSVAAKVARHAEIPVLILHEGGPIPRERHPGEPPLRVFVPLDGSDYARAALAPAAYLAATLAAPGNGALYLVYVVRSTLHPHAMKAEQNMAREYLAAIARQIHDRSLYPVIADPDLEITTSVVIYDEVERGIARVAEHGGKNEKDEMVESSDMIAMTVYGSRGPQPWVGSIIERVLRITHLPLLIVRPPEERQKK